MITADIKYHIRAEPMIFSCIEYLAILRLRDSITEGISLIAE